MGSSQPQSLKNASPMLMLDSTVMLINLLSRIRRSLLVVLQVPLMSKGQTIRLHSDFQALLILEDTLIKEGGLQPPLMAPTLLQDNNQGQRLKLQHSADFNRRLWSSHVI